MNWRQYFKLKEKRKKNFWIFFFILIVLGFPRFKDFAINGGEYCKEINVTCGEEVINNITAVNATKPMLTTEDYIWFDCRCGDLSFAKEYNIWWYRLFYSPLHIFVILIVAYIGSLTAYNKSVKKIDAPKEEKADEKKEEKK